MTFTRPQFDTFISTLPYPPNPFQLRVLESIAFESGNIVVSALAGSGKTSLLVQTAALLNAMGENSSMYVAFNVKIRDKLNERLPRPHQAINSHSLGMQILRSAVNKTHVDKKKWEKLTRDMVDTMGYPTRDTFSKSRSLEALCSKVMLNGVDPADLAAVISTATHYRIAGVYEEDEDGRVTIDQQLVGVVKQIIEKATAVWQRTGAVNFDEQIYLPIALKLDMPKVKWVFVDELQDLNILQQEIAFRSLAEDGRFIGVGDKHQCQPPETMVLSANGQWKSIADLNVGEQIVSYDRRSGHYMRRATVTDKVSRPYNGWMYTVKAGNKTSQATDNHRWLVRWENMLSDKWVTYLMRQGDKYRVGIVQMFVRIGGRRNNRDIGLGARMRSEKADAGWIIGIHDDYKSAFAQEQAVSQNYGLPQLTFKTTNGSMLSQEEIDGIYSRFIRMDERAELCLHDHGRDIQYPLINRQDAQQRRGGSTYFTTQSCNLISGFMSVPVTPEEITFFPKTSFKDDWQVIEVNREHYEGEVYSLNVERYHLYVADGIVTHNSIYGFAGADSQSFDRVIERSNATVLPLNICYRCAQTHIELARRIVPTIEAAPTNHVGSIHYVMESELFQVVKPGTMVMCRLNAPLLSAYFGLIGRQIPAKIMGRDIGADLMKTLDIVSRMDGFTYEKAVAYLERYRNQQQHLLSQKKNAEQQLQVLNDKIDCLVVCVENFRCTSIQGLKDVMADLFGDENKENWDNLVALCTVHKAKGLEADETVILKPLKMPLKWKGQQEWERIQEMNALYVALTRAKKKLTLLATNADEMKKLMEDAYYGTDAPEKTLQVEASDGTLIALPNLPVIEVVPDAPEPETSIEDAPSAYGGNSPMGESTDTTAQEAVTQTEEQPDKHYWTKEQPTRRLLHPNPLHKTTPVLVAPTPNQRLETIAAKITVEQIDTLIELLQAMREKKVADEQPA